MSEKTQAPKKGLFTAKNLVLLAFVGGLAVYLFAWDYVKAVYLTRVPATLADEIVLIPSGSNYDEAKSVLKKTGAISDEATFDWLAEKMNYRKEKMRAGRFKIKPGWSLKQLIGHLRNGEQAPVKVVLNNERLLEDVAGKVSKSIEADSAALLAFFTSPENLAAVQKTPQTLMSLFIPNTYEMFWTTTPKQFIERMKKESDAFWAKNGRLEKAKAQNLTPEQVYALASIVERETNAVAEKPTIAGAYLNRLKIGMKLQADPTAVFATRDFGARRVLFSHTNFDSPYNTYMYAGLPPGPISMASIPSLDAVLSPEAHKYLYFCAKADNSGTHAFAETLAGHNQNVDKFRVWMRQNGL